MLNPGLRSFGLRPDMGLSEENQDAMEKEQVSHYVDLQAPIPPMEHRLLPVFIDNNRYSFLFLFVTL